METLEELTQAIMADEQNKTYTEQGIKPLFSIPKTARINIVGQAPGIELKSLDFTGMTLVEIIYGIGWVCREKNFTNQVCLPLYQWIFISRGMENLEI